MPNRQRHRGAHPEDVRLFDRGQLQRMRPAAQEVVYLLGRGYPAHTAIAVVGDHHQLEARQREALQRALCSPQQRQKRSARTLERTAVKDRTLLVDGFNLIITVEVALSGGLILDCTDSTLRDLAGPVTSLATGPRRLPGLGGSYHPVTETDGALEVIGVELGSLAPARVRVFLDAPVSSSGRLRQRIEEHAKRWSFPVDVELVPNPDAILSRGQNAVTSDSTILDRCSSWVNLARYVVDRHIPHAWRSGSFAIPSTLE